MRMSNITAKIFIFLISFFCLIGIQGLKAEVSDPDGVLMEADQLYDKDQFTEAIDLYTELYLGGYYSQKMLFRLSFMHEKLGNFPDAIYYLRKIDQEYGEVEGEENIDQKIRNIIRAQGGKRVYTSGGWNFRLFFRNWGLLIYLLFGGAAIWLAVNYLLNWKKKNTNWRLTLTGFAWAFFLVGGGFIFTRAFLTSDQAVIIEPTSFYEAPSYAAQNQVNALSLGELVTIEDREDIWCEISAGGRSFWVPEMMIREL